MKYSLQDIKLQIESKIPERTVTSVSSGLLWGDVFELPEEMELSDVSAFASLCLEGSSPFPIESLGWGFVYQQEQSKVYVYASPWDRLSSVGVEASSDNWHILPSFISVCEDIAENDTIRFLLDEGYLSAIRLEKGSRVPLRIVTRKLLQEDPTETELFNLRSQLLKAFDSSGVYVEPYIRCLHRVDVVKEDTFSYEFSFIGKDDARIKTELSFASSDVWNLELRDEAFSSKEKKLRKQDSIVCRSFDFALYFLGFLFFLLLLNWGLGLWITSMDKTIKEQEPIVDRILSMEELAEKLEAFAQREMKPFSMLNSANELRDPSIHFKKIVTRTWNTIQIDGQTKTANDLNRYIAELENSLVVQEVEKIRSRTNNNQTTFSIKITFDQIKDLPRIIEPEEEALTEDLLLDEFGEEVLPVSYHVEEATYAEEEEPYVEDPNAHLTFEQLDRKLRVRVDESSLDEPDPEEFEAEEEFEEEQPFEAFEEEDI